MYQKTVVVGNLGNEPEFKYTPNGLEVCGFTVASNRKHKDGSEDKIWFSVSVFGNQAKPCADYLHKGSKVMVEGRLRANENGNPQTFTKKDGTVGSTYNLTANQVLFLDARADVDDAPESEDVAW
jgi:single-strand DNA-binding protein